MRGKHDLQEHVLRIEHENAGYIGANARLRFNGFVTSSAISRTDLGKKGHPVRGTLPGIICVCIGGWLYLREQYAAGDIGYVVAPTKFVVMTADAYSGELLTLEHYSHCPSAS